MAILFFVLRIVLILLGLLVLLAVVLLSLRTGIEATGINGDVTVDVRYGPLRIPVYPPPKREKDETGKPPEKQKAKKKSKRYQYSLNKEALDVGELTDLALTLLSELSGALRISKLRVRIVVGTDDAAKTGIRLGQISAVVGMMAPFLENTFDMKDYHVSVDADFDADHTEWAFTVFCSLRPVRLLWLSLRHGGEGFRLYKKLLRKEEAIKNE
ncbi:DUF2953 domain-containing protein [Agathobaculum sp.]|uniref:DUF2953 domain-containing protein n=1 Tax=Agathobaculum sp. TaxID=2048138 RepID=UPI002A80A3E8|nr:DUF2953 domain-containing protein [Agathobaculum sp.]MDY3618964.1 DUF2953 domain-containing protein [Agathobaculum sp.]